MKIQITQGIGVGPTELAAFDQALVHAGVANFNLIYLSSVLPAGCDVIYKQKPDIPNSRWGDRLYVVMAQKRTSQRNQEIWAGIGWIQDKKTGEGLLVEHEGHSETEVRADIDHSLMALAKNRNLNLGPHNVHVIGTKCENLPVCAVAIAVFQSTGWRNSGSLDKFKVLKRS